VSLISYPFTTYLLQPQELVHYATDMSTIVHLSARQFALDSGTGGISSTAIGLIVGVGVVPVFILVWVVSWLFWGYPNDRNFCCVRRRKKQSDAEKMESTLPSRGVVNEKANYNLPERQVTNQGMDRGNSRGGRLSKTDPRFSLQTIGSNSSVQVVQQPQRFV
jgi:hypothetical protein